MLELYVDDDRRGSKTQRNDSLHQAGTVDVSLNGFTNGNRIVVKILASASDKLDPSLKIELKPDKEDSLLIYTFGTEEHRRITIEDILDGKRVTSSEISPSGRFILLIYTETLPGGSRIQSVEVYDAQQKRIIFSEIRFVNNLDGCQNLICCIMLQTMRMDERFTRLIH